MKYTVTAERTCHSAPAEPNSRPVWQACSSNQPLSQKVVLHNSPSEVSWHIALKIIGFILFMQYEPLIEHGVNWHYKPDVVAFDHTGDISLWVDCGNIAVKKIDRVAQKLGPDTPFYIHRRAKRDAELLVQSFGNKVKHPKRVRVLAFDNGFVDTLAAHLDSTNHIQAYLGDTHIELSIRNRRGALELFSTIHNAG